MDIDIDTDIDIDMDMDIRHKPIWVDSEYNHYQMHEISNRYLLNILRFLENGGGWTTYVDRCTVEDIFEEANKRGLHHNYNVKLAILRNYNRRVEEDIINDNMGFMD